MPLTLQDALRLAAKDVEFAKAFIQEPSAFKALFQLSDAQVERISKMSASEMVQSMGDDPIEGGYYNNG